MHQSFKRIFIIIIVIGGIVFIIKNNNNLVITVELSSRARIAFFIDTSTK
jgi:hypothetical protein